MRIRSQETSRNWHPDPKPCEQNNTLPVPVLSTNGPCTPHLPPHGQLPVGILLSSVADLGSGFQGSVPVSFCRKQTSFSGAGAEPC